MLKVASARRRKKQLAKPNLVPILDAVFIFIFFLLLSAEFLKLFEVASDIPVVSDAPPPKNDKPPLSLVLRINPSTVEVYTGLTPKLVQRFKREEDKSELDNLHNFLIDMKSKHTDENTIVFEPSDGQKYEYIVEVMDAVRVLTPTDSKIPGVPLVDPENKRLKRPLFSNIIFGNLY